MPIPQSYKIGGNIVITLKKKIILNGFSSMWSQNASKYSLSYIIVFNFSLKMYLPRKKARVRPVILKPMIRNIPQINGLTIYPMIISSMKIGIPTKMQMRPTKNTVTKAETLFSFNEYIKSIYHTLNGVTNVNTAINAKNISK